MCKGTDLAANFGPKCVLVAREGVSHSCLAPLFMLLMNQRGERGEGREEK